MLDNNGLFWIYNENKNSPNCLKSKSDLETNCRQQSESKVWSKGKKKKRVLIAEVLKENGGRENYQINNGGRWPNFISLNFTGIRILIVFCGRMIVIILSGTSLTLNPTTRTKSIRNSRQEKKKFISTRKPFWNAISLASLFFFFYLFLSFWECVILFRKEKRSKENM